MGEAAPVVCRDLEKTYRGFWGFRKVHALRGISMEMERGEILGLLGPNGSGKTTALKILAGVCRPTRGEALLLGRDPRDPKVRTRLGFLPEDDLLYGFLNARETLDFFGRLFHIPRRERKERIERLLSIVDLAHENRKPVRSYSKGMLRRLSFAQALINEPEVLLLDEPTSGLDPLGILAVRDLLLSLQERGTSLLLASHLLSEVEKISNRVAILQEGEVLAEGKVQDLLEGEGSLTFCIRGLGEDAVTRLVSTVKKEGGEVEEVQRGEKSLERFFIETLREENRRKGGDKKERN